MIVNRHNTEHYIWGDTCDGWILRENSDLLIIEERMPPSTAEQRHYHSLAEQFFYVLEGTLTMELDGVVHVLEPRSGISVSKEIVHQARNESDKAVVFLVVSAPTSRGDRHY